MKEMCTKCITSCLDATVIAFRQETGEIISFSPYAEKLARKISPRDLKSLQASGGELVVDGEVISYLVREDANSGISFLYLTDPALLTKVSDFPIFGDIETIPGVNVYRSYARPFSGDFMLGTWVTSNVAKHTRYVFGLVDIEGSGLDTYEVAPIIRSLLYSQLSMHTVALSLRKLHSAMKNVMTPKRSISITIGSIFPDFVEVSSAGGVPVFYRKGKTWRVREMAAPPLNALSSCDISTYTASGIEELLVFSDGAFELDVGGVPVSMYDDFETFALKALNAGMSPNHLVHSFVDSVNGRFNDDVLVVHIEVEKVREACV